MPAVEVQVQLGEQRARVVRAPDRPELVVEEPRPARLQEAPQPLQVRRAADVADRLLGLRSRLLIVGQEEERPVAHEGAAQRRARLIPVEVGPSAAAPRRKGSGNFVPLPEVVSGAGELVGPRLGDHVDEAARRAAELGGGALIDHHQLLDGVLIECERRALSPALLAEERIVEIGPVDDEVVEDAALAANVELVAVRSLGDGCAGCEERQVHEVAAVARQPVHHLFQHALRAGDVRGVERCRQLADDRDGLGGHDPERDGQIEHFPDTQRRALDAFGAEAGGRRRHRQVVRPRRQQGAHERPGRRGLHGGQQVGLPVLHDDDRPRHRVAERVADRAADDAGGRSGLGRKLPRVQGKERRRQQHGGQGARGAAGKAERAGVRHDSAQRAGLRARGRLVAARLAAMEMQPVDIILGRRMAARLVACDACLVAYRTRFGAEVLADVHQGTAFGRCLHGGGTLLRGHGIRRVGHAGRGALRDRDRRDGPRAARRQRGGAARGSRPSGPHGGHRHYRRIHAHRTRAGRLRRDVHVAGFPRCRGNRCGGRGRGGGDPRRGDVGGAPRAGRGRREPRTAAVGDRVAGPDRRHPVPGRRPPGVDHARLPAADAGALVQCGHASDQRRGHARAAGQPAQPGPRPYAGAGQRQAPPPLVGHRLVRRRDGRRAGPGHLDHSVDRPAAGGGVARRRVGAVRLGRHRRRAELPAQERP